jgi:hypothetical protein
VSSLPSFGLLQFNLNLMKPGIEKIHCASALIYSNRGKTARELI